MIYEISLIFVEKSLKNGITYFANPDKISEK